MIEQKPNEIIVNISRFLENQELPELINFLSTEEEDEIYNLQFGDNNLSSIIIYNHS